MTTNPTPTQQGETLERCDFCADGGNPQVCQTQKYIHPGGVETDHPLYAVICQDCDARGPEENTPAKAAQRWSTRRAAVAGPRGDVLLPEWTECQSMFADGIATALSEFIRAYEPVQSTNPDDKAADEWRQALTAVLTAAEKLPLPTDYECVAPSEQVYVINLLRGICDADKQEVARLHLNLCARCQELAGGVIPGARVAEERESLIIEGNREEAIKLLRQLRETADPKEIQRQKESWAQLEAALNPTTKGDR